MSTLMKFFDPNDDLLITQRGLPHWAQDGCVVFITWRMNDSLPGDVLAAWRDQRNTWLTRRNIDPKNPGWKNRLHQLPPTEVADFHEAFTEAWHALLDRGQLLRAAHGELDLVALHLNHVHRHLLPLTHHVLRHQAKQ
jgi:hypothetical protein